MELTLVRPDKSHEKAVADFRDEFLSSGEQIIGGSEMLDRAENYDDWLARIQGNAQPENGDPAGVITDLFFAVNPHERIIGMIELRHSLDGYLKDFGQCGYSVRPSERGMGYAGQMLRMMMDFARSIGLRELQLTVERGNTRSERTIFSSGGRWQRSFMIAGGQVDVYRIIL